MLGLNPLEQEILDLTNEIARNGFIYFPEFCQIVTKKYREEDDKLFRQNMFKVGLGTPPLLKKIQIHIDINILNQCLKCYSNYFSLKFLLSIVSIVLRIIFPVSTLQSTMSLNVNQLQNICGTKQYDEKIKVRVSKKPKSSQP